MLYWKAETHKRKEKIKKEKKRHENTETLPTMWVCWWFKRFLDYVTFSQSYQQQNSAKV